MRTVGVTLAVVICGCASDEDPPEQFECSGFTVDADERTVSLADLPELAPYIFVGNGGSQCIGEPGDRRVYASVRFAASPIEVDDPWYAPLRDGNHWYCLTVDPSFTATIGGRQGTTSLGGWGCHGPTGPLCLFPIVTFDSSFDYPATDAELVLSDSSTTLAYALGDAFADRAISTAGGDWTFQPTQPATLSWSPATDLALLPATCASFDTPEHYISIATGFSRTADTITIPLPDMSGQGILSVMLHGVQSLPNATLAIRETVSHEIVLAP